MTPKYIQLSDRLMNLIQVGTYPIGSLLPTEEELSATYQVSRETVRAALSILVEKHLIQKRQGSGNRVISSGFDSSGRRVAILISCTDDYIFPEILKDMQSVLSQNQYSSAIFTTGNKINGEREALQQILSGSFAGLLAEGVKTALPSPNLGLYHRLSKVPVPLVFFHGGYPELENTAGVFDDNYTGGYRLTRYLISKGHTCIGGIFKSDDVQGLQRYQGYVTALHDADLPVPDDALLWFSTEDRYAMLECGDLSPLSHFISTRLHGCTALVIYNDEIAYQTILLLQKAGYQIPRNMSIVSFDNSYYCTLSPVPITSLSHESERTGAAAAKQLLSLLRGGEAGTRSLPWKLIERQSG